MGREDEPLREDAVAPAFLLGKEHLARGEHAEARSAFTRVVELDPSHVGALNNLALLRARDPGGLPEALGLLQRAAATGRASARVLTNLGRLYAEDGRLEEASRVLEEVVEADPTTVAAWLCLADVHLRQRGQDAARAVLERAAASCPDVAEIWNNLATARGRTGDGVGAASALEQAARLRPDHPVIARNWGDALRRRGELSRALGSLGRAQQLDPRSSEGWLALSFAAHAAGLQEEATAAGRAAWETAANREESLRAGSSLLFVAAHDPDVSPARLAEDHLRWGEQAIASAPSSTLVPTAPSRTPLRVGFLSPDFRTHVVARFFEPVLNAFDRGRIEPVLVSTTTEPDEVSRRLAAREEWVDVSGLDDGAARAAIRELRLGVLVDLAGHSGDSRVRLMAPRLAPVQLTWLGSPGSTGLPTVDGKITDIDADPPGSEGDYTERLVRLPRCAWAYPMGGPATPRGEGPAVLGCFNRAAKWSPPLLDAWARILAEAPDATLVLRASALDDSGVRGRLESYFAERRVLERVTLRGAVPDDRSARAAHGSVDLALDTFPYHGTTTTLDALAVGTPVLTCCGAWPASRVGASLLRGVGGDDLVTRSLAEYVSAAAALARAPEALRARRGAIRTGYADGPLADPAGLAEAFTEAVLGFQGR